MKALRDRCRREGRTVLVLDTWTALSPTADPLEAKDQVALGNIVKALADDIGGVVIVVDHSSKTSRMAAPLSAADIFGAVQKWAAAEHVIVLRKLHDRRLEVFVEGKDDAEVQRSFLAVSAKDSGDEKFTWAGTVTEIAATSTKTGRDNREAVYGALPPFPKTVSAKIHPAHTRSEGDEAIRTHGPLASRKHRGA